MLKIDKTDAGMHEDDDRHSLVVVEVVEVVVVCAREEARAGQLFRNVNAGFTDWWSSKWSMSSSMMLLSSTMLYD